MAIMHFKYVHEYYQYPVLVDRQWSKQFYLNSIIADLHIIGEHTVYIYIYMAQIKEIEPSAQILIFALKAQLVGNQGEGTMLFMLS